MSTKFDLSLFELLSLIIEKGASTAYRQKTGPPTAAATTTTTITITTTTTTTTTITAAAAATCLW